MKVLRTIFLDCIALLTFMGSIFLGIFMESNVPTIRTLWKLMNRPMWILWLLYVGAYFLLIFGGMAIVYVALTQQKKVLSGKTCGK